MNLNGFYRFFSGRNGIDPMFYILAALQLLLIFIGSIARILSFGVLYYICSFAQLALLAFMLFRVFSKDLSARAGENAWMLRTVGKITNAFSKRRSSGGRSRSDRIVVICPSCSANIRVKNERGRHGLNCPRCGTHFEINI